jgi:hypothetical protein
MFAVTFKHSDLGYIVSLVFLNGLVLIDVAAKCGIQGLPQARNKWPCT